MDEDFKEKFKRDSDRQRAGLKIKCDRNVEEYIANSGKRKEELESWESLHTDDYAYDGLVGGFVKKSWSKVQEDFLKEWNRKHSKWHNRLFNWIVGS